MLVAFSPVALTAAAVASTLAGGAMALRFRDRLHYLLGFTAGVLLGVVAFDLLPEIFALARVHAFDPTAAMIALVVGFLLYIGVSDILPEAHSRAGPGVAVKLIALTCCGAAFVYAVVRLSP